MKNDVRRETFVSSMVPWSSGAKAAEAVAEAVTLGPSHGTVRLRCVAAGDPRLVARVFCAEIRWHDA